MRAVCRGFQVLGECAGEGRPCIQCPELDALSFWSPRTRKLWVLVSPHLENSDAFYHGPTSQLGTWGSCEFSGYKPQLSFIYVFLMAPAASLFSVTIYTPCGQALVWIILSSFPPQCLVQCLT